MPKNIDLTRRIGGHWAVKREADRRASSLHETQREAIEMARMIARNNRAELFIHDRENKVSRSRFLRR
jgi:hypothetical protein